MKTNLLNKNLSLLAMMTLLCSSASLYAQSSKKGYDTWKASAWSTQIYLGGGIGIPGGSTKDNAYLGNGYGLQVGVYQPLYFTPTAKMEGTKQGLALGLQASGELKSFRQHEPLRIIKEAYPISDPATGETLLSTLTESDRRH